MSERRSRLLSSLLFLAMHIGPACTQLSAHSQTLRTQRAFSATQNARSSSPHSSPSCALTGATAATAALRRRFSALSAGNRRTKLTTLRRRRRSLRVLAASVLLVRTASVALLDTASSGRTLVDYREENWGKIRSLACTLDRLPKRQHTACLRQTLTIVEPRTRRRTRAGGAKAAAAADASVAWSTSAARWHLARPRHTRAVNRDTIGVALAHSSARAACKLRTRATAAAVAVDGGRATARGAERKWPRRLAAAVSQRLAVYARAPAVGAHRAAAANAPNAVAAAGRQNCKITSDVWRRAARTIADQSG